MVTSKTRHPGMGAIGWLGWPEGRPPSLLCPRVAVRVRSSGGDVDVRRPMFDLDEHQVELGEGLRPKTPSSGAFRADFGQDRVNW